MDAQSPNPNSGKPDAATTERLAYEAPELERPATATPTEQELEHEAPTVGKLDYSPTVGHDPYAAFRYPSFLRYQLGWVTSIIGQQIQSVAIGWEMTKRTTTPEAAALLLSYVGLVQAAPVILLALPAGHIADQFDRRRVVWITQLIAVMCSLALAVLSHRHGSVVAMYGVLLAGAIAGAVGTPARSALLPQVVPTEVFSNAVTWNSSFFQIASVLGPALAGLVILYSLPAAYVLDAICGAAFLAALPTLVLRHVSRSREPATLRSLAAGVRFVREKKIILATITLDLFAVLLGGATFLLPIFAKDILHVGEVGFGMLRASPAVGAFAMALVVAHLPPMRRAGRAMLWAVAGFGAATIVFGLSRSFWLSMVMLFLTGAFDNISVVVRHTLVQVLTPDEMRGRVSAVNNVFIGASNELGGWESGITAHLLGAVRSVVFGGIGTILTVLAVSFIWPQVRRFGSLQHAREQEPQNA
jgi:MFS family permease